jgi:hypothetical protein
LSFIIKFLTAACIINFVLLVLSTATLSFLLTETVKKSEVFGAMITQQVSTATSGAQGLPQLMSWDLQDQLEQRDIQEHLVLQDTQ